ncbi:MAG: hypothetical protein KAK00_05925 [Nanoarchaeota archaeon]|nr:hypothetical protein [Nanoarchaeota archaeon]
MKIKNLAIIVVVLIVLSIAAYSIAKSNKISLTDDISIEDVKDCETVYWNEEEPVYGTCTYSHTFEVCDDEPLNESCTIKEEIYDYRCQKGTETVQKSREVCKDKEILLTVDKLTGTENYKLEYAGWGKCSYETEGETAVITCDSRYDGNNDGICKPGESCIQFRVTKDGIQRLVKNSRNDFVEEDNTFFLEKLEMEAAK